MSFKRMGMTVAVLAVSALAWGCGEGDEGPAAPGTVEIKWKLDKLLCSTAGVIDVRVDLTQGGLSKVSDRARCSDGGITLDEVPVGVYDIRLLGMDAEDNAIYEGTYPGLSVVSGDEPSSPPAPITLTLRKGGIKLQWLMPEAGATCAFSGIAKVEVNVSQVADNLSLSSETYDCELDPTLLEDNKWLVIKDLPHVEVNVVLFGLDKDGNRTNTGAAKVKVTPKGYPEVKITLELCEGGCV